MSSFFVSDELFTIDVFSFKDKDETEFVTDPSKVPVDVSPQKVTFTFRHMNYKDSVEIKSSSLIMDMNGNSKIELYKLQDELFRKLLVKWDLKDDNTPVPLNKENIDKLNPVIAQVVGNELMGIVKIY